MSTFVKRTDVALLGAHTLPGRYFTSPDIFAEETEKIFLQRWLCAGRESRIAQPGQYFLQQIGTESIIVLRDRQHQVRAFYNGDRQGTFEGRAIDRATHDSIYVCDNLGCRHRHAPCALVSILETDITYIDISSNCK